MLKRKKINPYIFRAYDIRGIYGEDFDKETFQKIGFVLGKDNGKFLVGNDIRESGKILSQALIAGLQSSKAKVIYGGTGSFGQVLFSGSKLGVDKTLFVTASHLPAEWNGLKPFFGDGEPFSKEMIEEVRDEVLQIEGKKMEFSKPEIEEISLKNDYFDSLLDKFSSIKNNNLRVIVDCGNGSVGLVAPALFKRFGFKTTELFCQVDPSFPNRTSKPTFEATKTLRDKVIEEKADFGVAFDGDGDRAIIIDDRGRYLSGNQIGIILGKDILAGSKSKKVVKTVSCSMAIEEELKSLGAEFIEIPVGHTYLVSSCKREKAVLGIEESSHIVMREYFLFDDAILIPLKIAEIILKEKKKLSNLIDKIKIYPFEEITFKSADEAKFEVIKKLAEEFKKSYKKVNTLDGVKVYFEYGWILIRASNTSPKIRLYVEAQSKEKFEFLKQKFSKILKEKL